MILSQIIYCGCISHPRYSDSAHNTFNAEGERHFGNAKEEGGSTCLIADVEDHTRFASERIGAQRLGQTNHSSKTSGMDHIRWISWLCLKATELSLSLPLHPFVPTRSIYVKNDTLYRAIIVEGMYAVSIHTS